MNRNRRAVISLALMFAAACSPISPVPAAPTPEPACTLADGRKVADTLKGYLAEWSDDVKLASNTARLELAGPVAQLQRIRRDVEAASWPACSGKAPRLLVLSMESTINGLLNFQGARPYESDVRIASTLMHDFDDEFRALQL